MALAEEKMLNVQLLPAAFMRARSSMTRRFWSRKFSSMMKKERLLRVFSACSMRRKSCSPVSQKLRTLPLPRKKALVVQKLQPTGQPTEEMMVAEVVSAAAGILTPSTRRSKAEEKSG